MAQVALYDRSKGDSRWGFVDKTGKEIIAPKYDRICAYRDGLAVVERGEKKYYLINKTGKETPLNYEKIGYVAFDRLLVESNKKFGFINSKGEIVIPMKYDNAWDFSTYSSIGWLSSVRVGNKSGFIDTLGTETIPVKYDWVMLFREGLAPVKISGGNGIASDKWSYVDSVGNLVIPMNYNEAGYFSEGIAPVSKGLKNWGYIDKTGKEVIPFGFESADEFSEGYAAIKKNGKYGFIDREGKEVIPCKYELVVTGFQNRRASVVLNGKTISVDKTGKEN